MSDVKTLKKFTSITERLASNIKIYHVRTQLNISNNLLFDIFDTPMFFLHNIMPRNSMRNVLYVFVTYISYIHVPARLILLIKANKLSSCLPHRNVGANQ